MKYLEDGSIELNEREQLILSESQDIENAILYNENKVNPEVIHALIGYASLVKDTDPSNAENAIYLALEMFGHIENVEVMINPFQANNEPDPTRP